MNSLKDTTALQCKPISVSIKIFFFPKPLMDTMVLSVSLLWIKYFPTIMVPCTNHSCSQYLSNTRGQLLWLTVSAILSLNGGDPCSNEVSLFPALMEIKNKLNFPSTLVIFVEPFGESGLQTVIEANLWKKTIFIFLIIINSVARCKRGTHISTPSDGKTCKKVNVTCSVYTQSFTLVIVWAQWWVTEI